MESTTQSSSKVTVEYHDPSGLFPLVLPDLASRLPLRNLNWHSPPRPLRQIRSLHVDFVADTASQNGRPELARHGSNGPNSLDIVRSGGKIVPKERRHQIPGFRTSPYLKVYILRCDDKEAYKENDRQRIREWIRGNVTASGKRDDHDAFEWMILHVVIPGTAAASEPRWRESSNDPDELKERKGGPKWPGKNTRTVFDRLRADFNETGKAAQDRVSQIRLVKERIPADLVSFLDGVTTLEESVQERENAWNDVITKLKTLILAPFDRRVRHYEADIAEQEARRSLPGWNFCTFFIHKEGLAKALESIGLVEDALALYDELSLGLESIIRDIAAGRAEGTATSFALFTDDIKARILGSPTQSTDDAHDDTRNTNNDAATLFSKDYRESIVRSNISVFDFICYLFSRQKVLVLRLANAKSVRVDLGARPSKEGGEDLVLTSELCWRASTFIHNAARTLRQDMVAGIRSGKSSYSPSETESIVCSWIWAVAGQVLEQTAAPALLKLTHRHGPDSSTLTNGTPKRADLSMGMGANTHPQRTASLSRPKIDPLEPVHPLSRARSQGDRPPSSSGLELKHLGGLPGQAELATYRAELILVRRKMLEQVARLHGWHAGRESARSMKRRRLEVVDLRDEAEMADGNATSSSTVLGPSLRSALRTQQIFEATFEHLTELAIRHYFTATQSKFVERLTGDLAILKCQQANYEKAASYFESIVKLTETDSWTTDLETLSSYCKCLKHLERNADYTRVALLLLSKIVARRIERKVPRSRAGGRTTRDSTTDASEAWSNAVEASAVLPDDSVHSMGRFFCDVRLNPQLRHDSASDGFSLSFELTNVLDEELLVDEVAARLVSADDPGSEIWLRSDAGPVRLVVGRNDISVKTSMVTYGPYLVDKIVVSANKLRFVEEVRPEPTALVLNLTGTGPPVVTPAKTPPFVFVYPSANAFSADVRRSRTVHIDKRRHFEISLEAGRDAVRNLEVRLKPATAGLRLWLADIIASGIDRASSPGNKTGEVQFGSLDAHASASVQIPYSVEQATKELAVRLEVRYTTDKDTFTFLQPFKIFNELPLDVDVDDVFHLNALYSKFTVRATTRTPLSILEARLSDSTVYTVEAPPVLPLPLAVYRSHPSKLVYKISRKPSMESVTLKKDAALALDLCYMQTDEMLVACLRELFLEGLEQSAFSHLQRLLLPLVIERFQQSIQDSDLEMAAVIGEVRVPDYETVGWWELVRTLPESIQDALEAWLRSWHTQHSVLTVRETATKATMAHRITISVEVPNLDVVFSAALTLPPTPPLIEGYPPIFKIGAPIKADLQIKHTKDWSARSIFPNVPRVKLHGQDEDDSTFVVDIGADPDTWLVGGQRRRRMKLGDEPLKAISVLLIPLREGRHALPVVEISPQPTDGDASGPDAGDKTISCATYFESAGQSVQIVRDMRTSRVYIEELPVASSSRPGTASTRELGQPGAWPGNV
ncbi:unnamed protein product [Zymoseptoria tritici ST99CH_3D7]|uniref:Trafficking protein particle complex subunit 11 domain-containing protein n=1 Tax=Zymoseptoria tritici (strain ST99CH_3D7) TaxID=1276538 RepID=A0A1X7RK33_ZYMT9|nr:unnamed protein product [Zymoseptoria tritici ST99CH_3D7]